MKYFFLTVGVFTPIFLTACTAPKNTTEHANQMIVVEQSENFDTVIDTLTEAIAEKELTLLSTIDHQANAEKVNLQLRPTITLLFGNPKIGTQLMKSDQRIGLDLPLKMVIWEDENDTTFIGYYDASTLTGRYDIDDLATTEKMNGVLAELSKSK